VNVLILHQHFRTPEEGGALRSYFLAKALVDRGDKVQVVTGSDCKTYTIKNIEGIEVHYVPVPYSNYFGFWKRIFSFLKFVLAVYTNSKSFSKAHICYAISVPLTVGMAAHWMMNHHGVPYIFEVGDLWPDAPIELGVIRNSYLKDRLLRMEKRIYSNASAIIALSPAIHEAIEKKIPGKKIFVISNMADTEYFQPESKKIEAVEKFGVKDKFVIVYLGAMGFANGLEYLLASAKACAKENLPVQFLLAGDGVERDNLKRKAESMRLKTLSFVEFQTRDGIRELMNLADAVFVCYRHAAILETGSPNKFFDGLAAGKLIIINFGGWIKKEIEEAGCGFYVDPENPESIVPQLKTLLESGLLREHQQRARHLAEEKFSRQKLIAEWLTILDQTLPR
jgi:glycosyltransferase involved in cell wall biosynthesis